MTWLPSLLRLGPKAIRRRINRLNVQYSWPPVSTACETRSQPCCPRKPATVTEFRIEIEVQELVSRVPGMQPALKSLPGSSKEFYGLFAGEVHPVSSLIWVDKLAIFPLRHGSACLSPLGHANPALTRLTRSGSANAKP